MIKSFLSAFFFLFAFITLLVLFSIEVPPSTHWIFSLLPLFIPICLAGTIVFLILFSLSRQYLHIAGCVILLLLGWRFYGRTIQLFNKADAELSDSKSVKILSYNVRVFNNYEHLSDHGKAAESIIRFTKNYDADIKCLQEFYHKSPSKEVGLYNTVQKLKKKTPYHYLEPTAIILGQYFGLAIFSKYPIISKGEVKFPKTTSNQAIYADIKIGKDTIRVYNIHLQSMSIDEGKLPSGIYSNENKSRGRIILDKIIRGGQLRAGQLKALLESTANSPYKVIICGDLNDTPFSYTYEELNENFNNAFEEKGSGFGFTHNGKLNILRIDNIFIDKRLTISSFNVLNDIKYSDHFPIEAIISLPE